MTIRRISLGVALVAANVLGAITADPAGAATTSPTPQRVLDTRTGLGFAGSLDPGETIRLTLPAAAAAGATSVALNLTTDRAWADGFLSARPCDDPATSTSVLNYSVAHPATNLVMVRYPSSGVCITSSAPVDVIADLMGWFTGTAEFRGISPVRLVDTRSNGTRLRAGEVRRVNVRANSGIDASATAAALNVTLDRTSADGFVTVFPCGPTPEASTANFRAGETVASLTIASLSNGEICVYSSVATDLIIDVFGASTAAGDLAATPPARVLDTRNGTWSTGPARNDQTLRVRIAGRGGVPNSARSVLVTLTAVDGTANGFVTAWPCDQAMPNASVLNLWPGVVRANLALLPLSTTDGEICLRASTQDGSSIHLLADVVGYVTGNIARSAPPTAPTPPPAGGSGRFETLPVGATLPTDADCAARVRRTPEVRPDNAAANMTKGSNPNNTYPRVTGNFTGTTDEILQWAACKWGIDEDIVRAQIVKESWWHMWANGDNGESWGLGQVRVGYHDSAFEDDNAKRSSAYNVDYTYAVWRECFEGRLTWLNTVERGRTYTAGDAWGCLGVWFSGRWYTSAAITYIEGGTTPGYGDVGVKQHLAQRTWEQQSFLSG